MNKMGAEFLVTCQAKMAERAWMFFTPLLRRNLFQAAAAFIIAIIHGESKRNGTGDWIWEMLCSCMGRECGGVAAAQLTTMVR